MSGVPNGVVSQTEAPRGAHLVAVELFRCQACGEVVGVYEPIVVCDQDSERPTSRAAEPELGDTAATYYHRDCHAAESQAIRAPAPREASGR